MKPMERYVERVVNEALCPELGQALVMIYCRYLCHPEARQGLRAMVPEEAELLRQFDALDELHAEYPFTAYSASTWQLDLAQLYRHNLALGAETFLRQLRRLSRRDAKLIAAFDQQETTG